jgi:serine/threonine protein kinase
VKQLGSQQHSIARNLATLSTQLSPETVSKIRSTLRNNIITRTQSFHHLFRVSHIINYDKRFGLLLLAYFRALGIAVVLRRLPLRDTAHATASPSSAPGLAFEDTPSQVQAEVETRWCTPYTLSAVSETALAGERGATARQSDVDVDIPPVSATTGTKEHVEAGATSNSDNNAATQSHSSAPTLKSVIARFSSLTSLRCQHVVAHLGYHLDNSRHPSCAAGPCLYLVTELVGISLADLLHGYPRLPMEQARYVAQCVLLGLRCLHKHGIAHGELHAGHVFVSTHGDVKVGALALVEVRKARDAALGRAPGRVSQEGKEDGRAIDRTTVDRGAAGEEKDTMSINTSRTSPLVQTKQEIAHRVSLSSSPPPSSLPPSAATSLLRDPPWLTPEADIGYSDTPEADVWAFGVIMLQLCSGTLALADLSELAESICRCSRSEMIGAPGTITGAGTAGAGPERRLPDEVADAVAMCLQRDPAQRPSVDDLVSINFISGDANGEKWPREGEMEWRKERFSLWMRGCVRAENKR